MQGKLILFCGPSGSGKTTIVHHLLQNFPQLSFSISATTRAKRANEVNGVDYYFLSAKEFKQKISNNEFVEWEEVYADVFYGTLKSEVERIWKENKTVVFDVDVEGGLNIKKLFGKNLLTVFVRPPSVEELRKRIKNRGSETEESFKLRVTKAEFELSYSDKFDHVIVNDTLDEALIDANKLSNSFLLQSGI
jgi:guanylate kinase